MSRKWGEHPNDGDGLLRVSAMLKDEQSKPDPVTSNGSNDPTDWLAYLEAKPHTEPYLSIARAWRADKARIDALMLEYCPNEMTDAQRADWAKHQRHSYETSDGLVTRLRAELLKYVKLHENEWGIDGSERPSDLVALLGEPPSEKASEPPMTLGRLVLQTARGTVKERTVTGKELAEVRANMERYFKGPLQFREPRTDSEGPVIYDAAGNQVAMLFWPTHPAEETGAAEQATYALGRAMAAAASESEGEV